MSRSVEIKLEADLTTVEVVAGNGRLKDLLNLGFYTDFVLEGEEAICSLQKDSNGAWSSSLGTDAYKYFSSLAQTYIERKEVDLYFDENQNTFKFTLRACD